MSRILVLYFSGTGNTCFCANYLRNRIDRKNINVTLGSIETFPKDRIADYDLLVVGFPVYACQLPSFVKDYFWDIPLVRSGFVFLFCTKGFYAGNAIYQAKNVLENSGYITLGFAEVTMPGSDGLAFLKPDSKMAKKLCDRDYEDIDGLNWMAKAISEGIGQYPFVWEVPEYPVKKLFKGWVVGVLFHLCYAGIFKILMRKFRSDNHCVQCGICTKICPSGNITLKHGKVSFDSKCWLCMRCIHQCPKASIQIGKGTVGKMRWKGPKGNFNPLRKI